MRLTPKVRVAILAIVLGSAETALAEQKTKMEAFTGAAGAVLVKGYSEVGTLRGAGAVTIMAMEFKNARSGEQQKGLKFELAVGRVDSAFLDYDEIPGLLEGLDYIGKADASATEHAFYEVSYQTRGFRFVVFNQAGGKRRFGVGTRTASAYFDIEQLPALRDLIVKGKEALENPATLKRASPPATASVGAPTPRTVAKKKQSAPRAATTTPLPPGLPIPLR